MLGVHKLAWILAVVAVAAASLTVVSSADAAKPTTFREVRVISGSADYLVYETVVTQRRGKYDYRSTAKLSYITKHGKPRKLATGDTWNASAVRLAGSLLVFRSPNAAAEVWQWRDLATGASGSFSSRVELPGTPPHGWATTGHLVAAAPDGWIVTRDIVPATPSAEYGPADGFYLQHADGSIVALGVPAAGSTPHGESDALVAFDGGFREDQTQGASLMSFASPGTYVPLGEADQLLHCRSAVASRVACAVYDRTSKGGAFRGIRVFDAAGQVVLDEHSGCAVDSYNTAEGPYALFGKGLAWVTAHRSGTVWGGKGRHCATHRLLVRTASGKLVTEPGRYSGNPVAAFGGVVVGNDASGPAASTKLVLFTSAHHHRTVVTAR